MAFPRGSIFRSSAERRQVGEKPVVVSIVPGVKKAASSVGRPNCATSMKMGLYRGLYRGYMVAYRPYIGGNIRILPQ